MSKLIVFFVCFLEVFSVLACYKITGGITCMGELFYLVALPNLFILIIQFYKDIKFTQILYVSLAIVIVAYKIFTYSKSFEIQTEVTNLVVYLQQQKEISGIYPSNLNDYPKMSGQLSNHIQSYKRNEANITLLYYLYTPNITNYFDSKFGWGQSDD